MTAARWVVITSINRPTRAIEVVSQLCREQGWRAVVVGDTKTPADWSAPGVDYLSIDDQKRQFGPLADLIPYRHYCRKNLGYLHAIRHGAELIVDTDDDNIPYDSFGHDISRTVPGHLLSGPGWANVYTHFLDPGTPPMWPRGLPLDEIHTPGTLAAAAAPADCPVQQYLADNDPDVDAVFRLTTKGEFYFRRDRGPVVLDRDCWVPFNSQNTVFFADAFPLLYLPCFVSFRMTDIWRSFVAQAALWHAGQRVSFHGPTVEQVRNAHDLMKDFADEVDGYLHNRRIATTLTDALSRLADGTPLPQVVAALWASLEPTGIVKAEELAVHRAWAAALADAQR